MSSSSSPPDSHPEAFLGVEGGVVERWCFGVVGLGGWACEGGFGCVSVCVFEGDLVQQEEPFDGFAAVRGGHTAVVAQEVSDLTVQPFEA
ncbi:hypothetical protein QE410_000729 [Microbacterium sp. SORGH_AS 1204]|uniref:hypothetical protein n=1 Tax=Microbacterium sp. SORGH_AS_1204 TaxID=3041785 RepID=UPI0027950F91|nr:hypothetical protein [Microbacterium sp. SORGH_AS_1204]MDQ1135930.1 hypothetical protein [Microbacterium sp. SORGH_AS_1204]